MVQCSYYIHVIFIAQNMKRKKELAIIPIRRDFALEIWKKIQKFASNFRCNFELKWITYLLFGRCAKMHRIKIEKCSTDIFWIEFFLSNLYDTANIISRQTAYVPHWYVTINSETAMKIDQTIDKYRMNRNKGNTSIVCSDHTNAQNSVYLVTQYTQIKCDDNDEKGKTKGVNHGRIRSEFSIFVCPLACFKWSNPK